MINPTALRKAKIVCNFGLSGCNGVKILWPKTLEVWSEMLKYNSSLLCAQNNNYRINSIKHPGALHFTESRS